MQKILFAERFIKNQETENLRNILSDEIPTVISIFTIEDIKLEKGSKSTIKSHTEIQKKQILTQNQNLTQNIIKQDDITLQNVSKDNLKIIENNNNNQNNEKINVNVKTEVQNKYNQLKLDINNKNMDNNVTNNGMQNETGKMSASPQGDIHNLSSKKQSIMVESNKLQNKLQSSVNQQIHQSVNTKIKESQKVKFRVDSQSNIIIKDSNQNSVSLNNQNQMQSRKNNHKQTSYLSQSKLHSHNNLINQEQKQAQKSALIQNTVHHDQTVEKYYFQKQFENHEFKQIFDDSDTFLNLYLYQNNFDQVKAKNGKQKTMREYLLKLYEQQIQIKANNKTSHLNTKTTIKLNSDKKSKVVKISIQKIDEKTQKVTEEQKHYSISVNFISSYQGDKPALVIILTDIKDQIKELEMKQIQENDMFKNHIFRTVSHNLKTPLNAILSTVQVIQAKEQKVEEIQRTSNQLITYDKTHDLNTIKVNSHYLNYLVKDILDFSNINKEKLKLTISLFSLEDVFQEIIGLVSIQAQQKNLIVDFTIDQQLQKLYIQNDETRLKQVILNLVMNALKFTYEGQIIIIASLSSNENEIIITVQDTGKGIGEDKMKKLFKIQTSYDDENVNNTSGVGLGLTIAQYLVGQIGSKQQITINSKVNVGSQFSFSIYKSISDNKSDESKYYSSGVSQLTQSVIQESAFQFGTNFKNQIGSQKTKNQFETQKKFKSQNSNVVTLNNNFNNNKNQESTSILNSEHKNYQSIQNKDSINPNYSIQQQASGMRSQYNESKKLTINIQKTSKIEDQSQLGISKLNYNQQSIFDESKVRSPFLLQQKQSSKIVQNRNQRVKEMKQLTLNSNQFSNLLNSNNIQNSELIQDKSQNNNFNKQKRKNSDNRNKNDSQKQNEVVEVRENEEEDPEEDCMEIQHDKNDDDIEGNKYKQVNNLNQHNLQYLSILNQNEELKSIFSENNNNINQSPQSRPIKSSFVPVNFKQSNIGKQYAQQNNYFMQNQNYGGNNNIGGLNEPNNEETQNQKHCIQSDSNTTGVYSKSRPNLPIELNGEPTKLDFNQPEYQIKNMLMQTNINSISNIIKNGNNNPLDQQMVTSIDENQNDMTERLNSETGFNIETRRMDFIKSQNLDNIKSLENLDLQLQNNNNFTDASQHYIQEEKNEDEEDDKVLLNILIVDDCTFNISCLKGILSIKSGKDTQLNMQQALNGQQALDMVMKYWQQYQTIFDIIFMDINMPVMDGIECTQQINKLVEQKQIPQQNIYICSANYNEKQMIEKYKNLKAEMYLEKPVDIVLIQNLLDDFSNKKKRKY